MLVANFTTVRPEMSNTRTYEDFSKFLGERPHQLGVVSRMYPHLTATFLTEALRNVYYGKDKKKGDGFTSIDNSYFEWQIETNYIKRVPFAGVPVGDGANGSEIEFLFGENYYQKEEIFKIEASGQQIFVTTTPVRKADNLWSVMGRILNSDYSEVLDVDACQVGDLTRFIGNAKPELHDIGFVKYQSNIEKMRNYMSTIRVDDSYSSLYALKEDSFIKISNGEGNGERKEKIFKLDPVKKNLIENFMTVRENMLLLAKGTMGVDGKSTLSTADGRPIRVGDGMIPQIERFASKSSINTITINTLYTVIQDLASKADDPIGNHFTFICNEAFWNRIQVVLGKYLADKHTDGAYLWSKDEGGKYLKVGTTFSTYEFGGNTISFKVDRTLSREYPNELYAVAIDLTTGQTNQRPPVEMYTLKGKNFILNEILGVGGKSGGDGGVVSTPVAGSQIVAHGYCGIAVYNPYRSHIIRASK